MCYLQFRLCQPQRKSIPPLVILISIIYLVIMRRTDWHGAPRPLQVGVSCNEDKPIFRLWPILQIVWDQLRIILGWHVIVDIELFFQVRSVIRKIILRLTFSPIIFTGLNVFQMLETSTWVLIVRLKCPLDLQCYCQLRYAIKIIV